MDPAFISALSGLAGVTLGGLTTPEAPDLQALLAALVQTVVRKTMVHARHAPVHHVSRRTVSNHRVAAPSATTAAVDTSVTTRTDTTRGQEKAQAKVSDDSTVVERRTVIHRDDDGNVYVRQGDEERLVFRS